MEDRAYYSNLILQSASRKKLIVSGPGTGKTFTFTEALRRVGERGLALTFINNLVRDLKTALSELADVFTFHGYCKYLMHQNPTDGLTADFNYYPALPLLIEQDFSFLGHEIDRRESERALHYLDDSNGVISELLRLGNYYNTVSHTDLVYRMVKHFESHPTDIPVKPLIVVDEYQDFSLMETRFIELLSTKSPVLIAGDDDQALYAFKHASANYLRQLAADAQYEKFELPHCSRCTQVIVDSYHDILRESSAMGLLNGRLHKEYVCYLPDKQADSDLYPDIVHAECSVERNNAQYIGRYVKKRIAEISPDEIKEANAGKYPAALVIGPEPFLSRAYNELKSTFPQAILKKATELSINVLSGYEYLSRDNRSNLGWRILLYLNPIANTKECVVRAVTEDTPLVDLIPADYVAKHLGIADLVRKLIIGEELTATEVKSLEDIAQCSIEQVKESLSIPEDLEEDEAEPDVMPEDELNIVCTSLVGAKGLSGGHVFILGLNNEHFPRNPHAITDSEVCSLLVAITRTRKKCYLLSCRRFGNIALSPSIFLNWLQPNIRKEIVDAAFFKT